MNSSFNKTILIEEDNQIKLLPSSGNYFNRNDPQNQEERAQIIATMWTTGYSVDQIAKELSVHKQTVWNQLKTPLVLREIKRIKEELDEHFQMLRFKLVSVIRDAMDSVDPQIALAGAAMYVKTAERMYGVRQEEISTEDVVRKLLMHSEEEVKELENESQS